MLATTTPPPSLEPHRWRPVSRLRRLSLRTTPGRVGALAAVVVLAIGGFYIVANIAVGNARDGLRVIGHDAGPQVLATSNLYYALGDMDSQVASILLSGSQVRALASRNSVATVRTVPLPTARSRNGPKISRAQEQAGQRLIFSG